jgi:hypothetical protein
MHDKGREAAADGDAAQHQCGPQRELTIVGAPCSTASATALARDAADAHAPASRRIAARPLWRTEQATQARVAMPCSAAWLPAARDLRPTMIAEAAEREGAEP